MGSILNRSRAMQSLKTVSVYKEKTPSITNLGADGLFCLLSSDDVELFATSISDYAVLFPRERRRMQKVLEAYLNVCDDKHKASTVRHTLETIMAVTMLDQLEGK